MFAHDRASRRPVSQLRSAPKFSGVERIEEVTSHPLLDLLRQVNPVHNAFDLWELTTLYQEVIGIAYWLLEFGPLNTPVAMWPLPSHRVTPTANGYVSCVTQMVNNICHPSN
jgi:hypothetical protein